MKYLLLTILLSFAGSSLVAQGSSKNMTVPMPSVDLPDELARVLRDYEKGWRAKDAEYLASLFTEDAFIMRPGHAPVRGRQQIAESYKGSGGPLFLRALEYSTSNSIGYIIGGYTSKESTPDTGKYMLTLRKVEDRWFITADMDNGNGRRE